MDAPPRRRPLGVGAGAFIKEAGMLSWALIFFILAIMAAALGFGGLAGAMAGVAKILFFVFLVLLVATFIMRAFRGRSVL